MRRSWLTASQCDTWFPSSSALSQVENSCHPEFLLHAVPKVALLRLEFKGRILQVQRSDMTPPGSRKTAL
ncbi:hypothetical protein BDR06DRAFT_945781 [Suillus hirtellus]|nr:hypothetical protein BDR06DRAFT_945781 [Suillus hirtellus]